MNQPLLDLNTVYTELTHIETMSSLAELKQLREEYLGTIELFRAKKGNFTKQINAIQEQVDILSKNITTLENALLCHLSKITEKHNINGQLYVINLN